MADDPSSSLIPPSHAAVASCYLATYDAGAQLDRFLQLLCDLVASDSQDEGIKDDGRRIQGSAHLLAARQNADQLAREIETLVLSATEGLRSITTRLTQPVHFSNQLVAPLAESGEGPERWPSRCDLLGKQPMEFLENIANR